MKGMKHWIWPISQAGQKILPIKLQKFFWMNQSMATNWSPLFKVDQSGLSISWSKIILTNQITGFATRVGENSCKNCCHHFWLTETVAFIGICNWITIGNIIRPLTAKYYHWTLSKFYVDHMTALTTPRSAPVLNIFEDQSWRDLKNFYFMLSRREWRLHKKYIVKTDQCRKFSFRQLRKEDHWQVVVIRILIKWWFYFIIYQFTGSHMR